MEEQYEQKEGLVNKKEYEKQAVKGLLSDPLQVNSFLKLYDLMVGKAIPLVRKIAFANMLQSEEYSREGDVFFMKGAQYNSTEKQTAAKLTSAGFYVVFPSEGQIKAIKKLESSKDRRKNDVYIYDKATYHQSKVDLKTVNSGSATTIAKHVKEGSTQAPVVALDVQGGTNRWSLIKGIRTGWDKDNTRRILVNWKGQWHQLKREHVFGDYMENAIK